MKTINKLLVTCSLLGGMQAHAGIITNTVNVDSFVSYGQSISYTHNLGDDPMFEPGSVLGGNLSIQLVDDEAVSGGLAGIFEWVFEFALADFATVIVEGADGDTGGLAIPVTGSWDNSLGTLALAAVNAGALQVQISGFLGADDFFIGESVLTLDTADVPTPATLALFGLGLAGLGMTRRRKTGATV